MALLLLLTACGRQEAYHWQPYDESADLEAMAEHEEVRMHFQLINSKVLDKNTLWQPFNTELDEFGETRYDAIAPQVLDRSMAQLQEAVSTGEFTYEELCLFYLYRIRHYESDNDKVLNALIATNPDLLKQAREKDRQHQLDPSLNIRQPLFGMPIILKDNINAAGMDTTAGAIALRSNHTDNAFITRRLLENGALVLGKANLSEWAYFFCEDCPLGYSAMGGQTMNPYGRMQFETGGSSSGSAVAVAANYAAAAVGTETSGSVLSPAGSNAVVGFKPSTGTLSRSGIVPIAGGLDTPGPITRSVADAVAMFNAMAGYDENDSAMPLLSDHQHLGTEMAALSTYRLAYFEDWNEPGAYSGALKSLDVAGAELISTAQPAFQAEGFTDLLALQMQRDLPRYLKTAAGDEVRVDSVSAVADFNERNPALNAPYGQHWFDYMTGFSINDEDAEALNTRLRQGANAAMAEIFEADDVDVLLSTNSYHAGLAALANYPALTLPMGRDDSGKPTGLTLIMPTYSEQTLISIALVVEAILPPRPILEDYP